MLSDDQPWTPERLQSTLDAGGARLRGFLNSLQRRIFRQVASQLSRYPSLRERHDVAERDDLVQEVLVRLVMDNYRRLRSWTAIPAYLWAYIYGFSRNVVREAFNKWRRHSEQAQVLPQLQGDSSCDSATRAETRHLQKSHLIRILDELPEHLTPIQWEVFRLYSQGKSPDEIAAMLGKKRNNIDQFLHVIRQALKMLLRDVGPEGGAHG